MTLFHVILSNLILIAFNGINSEIDAYRILKNKTIAHGINFTAYLICTGLVIWIFQMPWPMFLAFPIVAFFNRQVFFDIPLNWRRHLSWNYVSLDKPPKALMDRIEVRLFGYNGTAPTLIYIGLCLIGTTIQFFL